MAEQQRPRKILADEFAKRFLAAMGIDPFTVRRVVIDAEAGAVLVVYIEHYGDERLLDIQFPTAEGVVIRGVPAPEEPGQ